MPAVIKMGAIELRFLQSKEQTGASIDMFEMTLAPNARMPVPHYHESWDEAVFGLSGTTRFTVDGKDIDLRQGESLFIKRGIVHGFNNTTDQPAKCLSVLTPGALGPAYFREMAGHLMAATPDREKMKETMTRYGLIPAPVT